MASTKAKRSAAAKKAAATRKRNQQEAPQVDRLRTRLGEEIEVAQEIKVPSPEEREVELEQERMLHAARTGGGEVREGELQAEREEHNRRTDGIVA